jgi:hypothetical protein
MGKFASMFLRIKRLVHGLCTIAEPATAVMESAIFAAFATTLLLSFYGALGQPLLYAGTFAVFVFLFMRWMGATVAHRVPLEGSRFQYYAIAFVLFGLLFLACFMSPDSADEQRTKLARMIIATDTGTLWDTSRIDKMAVMYFFPAAYYTIFTAIDAMRLMPAFYSIMNALLVMGAVLNVWLLFGHERSIKHLFYLVLFFAAPQFMFTGLAGHEEGLTLFLATRAAVWLIVKPVDFKTVFFFLLCAVLAVAVKMTTAIFLSGALLMLLLYFGGKERLMQWLRPKTIGYALIALVPIGLIVALPDLLTNHNNGVTFAGQQARLAAYHKATDAGCAIAQFYLRLFELGIDVVRNFVTFVRLDLTAYAPIFEFMPKRCVHDSTALMNYFMPDAMIRENVQFGALPWVAFAALFMVQTSKKKWVAAAWGLFLFATAVYSIKLMYWSGTGRYFMIGILGLLPAFLLFMNALETKPLRLQRGIALFLLLPAMFVFISLADNIPRRILRGDRVTYLAGDLAPALHALKEGKVNIYFNDLMPFYTLLRLIPSRDVWMKDGLMADATNIIAIPKTYSSRTNWHNDFWMLPVPSARGEFIYVRAQAEKKKQIFGNIVPTAFYIGKPNVPANKEGATSLHRYTRGDSVEKWVKSLGAQYGLETAANKEAALYFIREINNPFGLCMVKASDNAVVWHIEESFASCRSWGGV